MIPWIRICRVPDSEYTCENDSGTAGLCSVDVTHGDRLVILDPTEENCLTASKKEKWKKRLSVFC